MPYSACGKSGLQLPKLSLGLWYNFGGSDCFETAQNMLLHAFDNGITHFDLANNYGIPAGSAEETMGTVLSKHLRPYRDELIISTKAGYCMWPGPYGDGGSRKYLLSSINQSLQRMNLEYVDIFYHHRFDPNTPIEETMLALDSIYRSGKALYIGISNYSTEQTIQAIKMLNSLGVPCLIHQFQFSMFQRNPEKQGLIAALNELGIGSIAFSPLAQGLLTDRYLHGIPENSRVNKPGVYIKKDDITPETLSKISSLHTLAQSRSQSLAEMAIAWIWQKGVTSVLIGASSVAQLQTNLTACNSPKLTEAEMQKIDEILG